MSKRNYLTYYINAIFFYTKINVEFILMLCGMYV